MRSRFLFCAAAFLYCAESYAQPVVNSGAQIITKATQAAGVVSGTTTITGGATTQVCFNDGATLSCGNAAFVFDKATGTLTVTILSAGTLTATTVTSGFNLGNADTTITRSAAGVMAVEGIDVVTTSGTQTLTNKTANGLQLGSSATILSGTPVVIGASGANGAQLWESQGLTPDSVAFATGVIANSIHIAEGNDFYIGNYDFQNADCGTSACTDPHLIGHSHIQDTTSYWSLYNDGVNSYHKTGVGGLGLPGMIFTVGTVPAVSNTSANSCGTTTATITGTDTTGVITVGATSGTSCTLTFNVAALNRRQCWANDETTAVLTRYIYLTTTTAKIDGVFTAGDKISYGCIAY